MTDKPIRVLIAKPGLDGHDRGANTITKALRNAGFEVIYTGLHQSVEKIASIALQEDVDVIGLSILSGAHLPITEQLIPLLIEAELTDKLLLVGGLIPDKDVEKLTKLGVDGIFPSYSRFEDIIAFINEKIQN